MRILFVLSCLFAHCCTSVLAGDWQVETVELDSRPVEVWLGKKGAGISRVRLLTSDGKTYRLGMCGGTLCVRETKGRPGQWTKPDGALPDAVLAIRQSGKIVRAWMSEPTHRYRHGILGDDIEAGGLTIIDDGGNTRQFKLDINSVFEDLNVRIVDLDKDNVAELVVVRSYLDRGSCLSILEYFKGNISIAAETPPLGFPNHWLNPAGIADFDGDGWLEIALVVRPDSDGILEFWEYKDAELHREMRLKGFSNHVRGARAQNMSISGDFDGDGIADLMLPDSSRRILRIISLADGEVAEPARIPLPGQVVTQFVARKERGRGIPAIVVGLDNGMVAVIRKEKNKGGTREP